MQAQKKASMATTNVVDNTEATSAQIAQVPGASQLSVESQQICYNDQMSSNLC